MMYQTEAVIAEEVIHDGVLTLQLVRLGEPVEDGDVSEGIYLKRPQQFFPLNYAGPLNDDRVAAFFTLFPNCERI